MYNKKNVLIVIISIIISILLIELSLRIIGFNKYKFKGYPPSYFTTINDRLTKKGVYDDNFDIRKNIKETDFIFNDSKPHKVWGNEIGCFDESIANIEDGYILAIGDSNSWGYVPYEKNWSYLLEKKIKKKILNCGVPAYSTIQELHKIKKILGSLQENPPYNLESIKRYEKRNLHKPSLIILQYSFNNDFLGDYLFPQYKVQNNILTTNKYLDDVFDGTIRYKEENKFWDKLKYDLNEKFYLFRLLHRSHSFLRKKIKHSSNKKESSSDFKTHPRIILTSFDLSYLNFKHFPWAKKAWKAHLENILEFKKISVNIGTELLFVFWGDLPDYSHKHFKEALNINKNFKKGEHIITLNNDKLLFKFLEENNINYLNLSKLAWDLAGYKSLTDEGEKLRDVLIWKNDNHLNIEGNKFMSEKIYNKLLDDNIIVIGVDK